jgi:tetratricopeptide (TPR) repeat protein
VLLYQNEPEEALEQYAAACRLAPTEARNWYGVGRVQARLGADSLAAIALERACVLDTSYQKAVYNLSLLYRRLGRSEDGRLALERSRVLQARQGKEKQRVELKMADPDPARVQFRLAGLYNRRGRPAAARARLLRARRLGLLARDTGGTLPTETMAADRIEHLAGLESMERFDYSLAVAHYRAAVDVAPDEATHHRGLGLALVESERIDEAIEAYRESLRLQPDLGPALSDLALVLFKERADPEQAIVLMERAVSERPGEKIYRYNLGHILHSVGRYADAASHFEEVLVLDPASALTLYSLGVSRIRLGQHDRARERLLRALEINPEYGAAYYELAQALEGVGELDKAVEAYRNCLQREPRYKYAHYGLGLLLAKLGRVDESRAHLDRFVQLPDHKKPEYVFFAPPGAR